MKHLYIALMAAFILVSTQAAKSETEPNNTFSQANSLAPNGNDGGGLTNITDNTDWWKVTVIADGKLTVSTTAGVGHISLSFYDADGVTYLSGNDFPKATASVQATHFDNLAPGTYFIEVFNNNGTTGTYTIVSSFVAAGLTNDPFNNDTAGAAVALGLNTTSSGHLGYYTGFVTGGGYTDRSDWWKFTTTQDGALTIRTTSDTTLDLDLEMYDIDKITQIAFYDTSFGIHEATHHFYLMPGTYYVHSYIPGNPHKYGAYIITSIFTAANGTADPNGNDVYTSATPIGVPATSSGHIGFYTGGYTDLVDWWKVSVPSDGQLIVNTVSETTGDIDLYMYDVNGTTQIASYDTSFGINEATHFSVMPGTYYIKGIRDSPFGTYTPYNISTHLNLPSYANDLGNNDLSGGALKLIYGDSSMGHLGYYSAGYTDETDWYYVTIPAGLDTFILETFSDNSLDLDISLYLSPDLLIPVASANSTGNYERIKLVKPTAGTYYAKLMRRGTDFFGGYKIRNRGVINTLVNNHNISIPSIHPNPATDKITITVIDALLDGKVEIVDMLGHQIRSSNIIDRTSNIDLSNLPSGVYCLLIKKNGELMVSTKIVKQ